VEEAVLTVCTAVSRAEMVGKFNTETESEREKRQLMRGVMLDTSPRSRDTMIAKRIKVQYLNLTVECG
jgi:hypothetical protein